MQVKQLQWLSTITSSPFVMGTRKKHCHTTLSEETQASSDDMLGKAQPYFHKRGVLWLLKVKHLPATMPVRIWVIFLESSACSFQIKVMTPDQYIHTMPAELLAGNVCQCPSCPAPCQTYQEDHDTPGRPCLNWKLPSILHVQEGQLPRPLLPA